MTKSKGKKSITLGWEGYRPSHPPSASIPEFEREYDYPYGTTRSGSKPVYTEIKSTSHDDVHRRYVSYRFFKPVELREVTTVLEKFYRETKGLLSVDDNSSSRIADESGYVCK